MPTRIADPGPAREAAVRDARMRLARQIPDAEKAARADFVIENTGDLGALRAQVEFGLAAAQAESNKRAIRRFIRIRRDELWRVLRAVAVNHCAARCGVNRRSKKGFRFESYEITSCFFWLCCWWVDSGISPRICPRAWAVCRCSDAHGSSSPLELTEAQAAPAYDAEEQNNIAVYKRVLPSVVNITSTTLVFNFFYGQVPQQGQGSGFILDKAGHVLTNFHVVEGANRGIEVQLSNKHRYSAKVIGTDKVARPGAAADRRARTCSR